jgi:hypothetical protein
MVHNVPIYPIIILVIENVVVTKDTFQVEIIQRTERLLFTFLEFRSSP